MDRRITSRLNMANAFNQVCNDNTATVGLVPAFVALVTQLGTRISALQAIIQRLSMNDKGIRADKINWKEELALKLSIVCGAGFAYARSISNVVMEGNFSFSATSLSNMRDTELIETARSIIALQGTVAAQLVDYGITTAFMTEVQAALNEFEKKNPLPIVNVYTDEAEREEALTKAFELSDFVLNDMMKAALIYKVLAPTFYQSLENASRISKVGVRHEDAPEAAMATKEALAPPSEVPSDGTAELLATAMNDFNDTTPTNETTEAPAPSMNGAS